MTSTKLSRRAYVDSLFVSRSYGDRVRIRTYLGFRGDAYVITANGRRVLETRAKSRVRAYIVDHDCQQVEKF